MPQRTLIFVNTLLEKVNFLVFDLEVKDLYSQLSVFFSHIGISSYNRKGILECKGDFEKYVLVCLKDETFEKVSKHLENGGNFGPFKHQVGVDRQNETETCLFISTQKIVFVHLEGLSVEEASQIHLKKVMARHLSPDGKLMILGGH